MAPPSPAIKMLIGSAPPAAPLPATPWEEARTSDAAEGDPHLRPAVNLAGWGWAIRGRPRPAPTSRERLPNKMNVQWLGAGPSPTGRVSGLYALTHQGPAGAGLRMWEAAGGWR